MSYKEKYELIFTLMAEFEADRAWLRTFSEVYSGDVQQGCEAEAVLLTQRIDLLGDIYEDLGRLEDLES
jgi:hypothetical protein